jgi:hypothetical protein
MHWPSNVFDLLLAHVIEGEIELFTHLLMHDAADAGPARVGERFQTRRDVDPSPKMSRPSRITSPRLVPMRNSIRFSFGSWALRSAIAYCTSTAQRTASTTLENSTSKLSPVVLTIRPRCSLTLGSPSSRQIAFNASSVPSSSPPISLE